MFEQMTNIVPEGEIGDAVVSHFEISEEDAKFENMRMMFGGRRDYVRPGKYVRLHVNKTLFMSDTDMERDSNLDFIRRASGDVLIAGLGIGLVIAPLLKKEGVTSITVIERSQDVVELVAPSFEDERLNIICADIMEWKPEKGTKYDTIYFDIWPDICEDNLKQIATLHQRFKFYKRGVASFMDSWMRERLLREKRQNRSYRYGW